MSITFLEMKNRFFRLFCLSLVFTFGNENLLAITKVNIPAGRYYIAREKLAGPEFADFDYFEIKFRIKKSATVYSGKLFAKTREGYAELPLRKIRLTGKRLRFETNTVDGVRFIFDGQFLNQRYNHIASSCVTILQGKLMEIDKKEGALENDFRFKYIPSTIKNGSCI